MGSAASLPTPILLFDAGRDRRFMKEIWKDIEGYEGLYQVSNFGRVKSFHFNREKILNLLPSYGYLYVNLCDKQGKRKRLCVHRLVAKYFLDDFDNHKQINHIDGNKMNNFITNLEMCTAKENSIHRVKILNKGNMRRIKCIETGNIYNSIKEAADDFGLHQNSLVAVLRKYKYQHTFGGYHWVYVE